MLYFRFLLALTVTISAVCSLLSCAGPAGAQTSRWRVPADFEQHPALLLGASQLLFHHPETLADIAGALEGRALVYGLLSSDAQASEMRRLLRAHDLPENAIRPVVVPVQSMWLRDYGPVFVQRDDGKVGVIDARYGGSEHNPDDDDVPTALAERWGAPVLDSELWLEGAGEAFDRFRLAVAEHVGPLTALAFVAGAFAMAAGARLALLAALLLLAGEAALAVGLLPVLPTWLEPLAMALLVAGIVQGAATLVLGEQTGGNMLTAALLAMVVFVLWRAPGMAARGAFLVVKQFWRR